MKDKDTGATEQLELTDEMLERNDTIYNAVYSCIKTLVEQPDLAWNMEIIGDATETMIETLERHGFKVRYPSVVTEADGKQHYEEY